MKWVSVNDHLPSTDNVLGWHEWKLIYVSYFADTQDGVEIAAYFPEEHCWYDTCDRVWTSEVKFWSNLPDHPKTRKNNAR